SPSERGRGRLGGLHHPGVLLPAERARPLDHALLLCLSRHLLARFGATDLPGTRQLTLNEMLGALSATARRPRLPSPALRLSPSALSRPMTVAPRSNLGAFGHDERSRGLGRGLLLPPGTAGIDLPGFADLPGKRGGLRWTTAPTPGSNPGV